MGIERLYSTGTSPFAEIRTIMKTNPSPERALYQLWGKEVFAAAANRDYLQAVGAAVQRQANSMKSPEAQEGIYLCLSMTGKGYRNAGSEQVKTAFKNVLFQIMLNEGLSEKDVMDICRHYGSGRDLRRMQEMLFESPVSAQN